MDKFGWSFLANLAAGALIAVVVYIIITRPGEKRKAKRRRLQALGLLKSEMEINANRVRLIASAISDGREGELPCPLHFSRGAWNALRASGFIAELADPHLAYSLFRMNEICTYANNNLRLWERAYLEDESKRTKALRKTCLRNCESLDRNLADALHRMSGIEVIGFDQEIDDDCLDELD